MTRRRMSCNLQIPDPLEANNKCVLPGTCVNNSRQVKHVLESELAKFVAKAARSCWGAVLNRYIDLGVLTFVIVFP